MCTVSSYTLLALSDNLCTKAEGTEILRKLPTAPERRVARGAKKDKGNKQMRAIRKQISSQKPLKQNPLSGSVNFILAHIHLFLFPTMQEPAAVTLKNNKN